MTHFTLREVENVEVLTLDDNYVNAIAYDNSDIITRAELRGQNCIIADHGFSALIETVREHETVSVLFDFGQGYDTAARNADNLGINLSGVHAAALSHGHMDHFGGIEAIGKRIKRKNIPLTLHPGVFRPDRMVRSSSGMVNMPCAREEEFKAAGFKIIASEDACFLSGTDVLFLGQIPRVTQFEKGAASLVCREGDRIVQDIMPEDTSLVIHLKGKGLIVISGCAHSGIINTVHHAMDVTGISDVHAVMGGFHLSGSGNEELIAQTIAAMMEIDPDYVIPTHCTGREAAAAFEQAMPGKFILNMAGTRLTFKA